MLACEAGHVEIIELLIEKAGESILDYVCKSGTPLHATIIGQKPGDVLEAILDVVEDSSIVSLEDLVNRKDLEGIHPLYLAVHSGNTELTQILLDCGSDPFMATEPKHGTTLLHVAAELGMDEMAQIICDVSPELLDEREDIDSNTPLHVACAHN